MMISVKWGIFSETFDNDDAVAAIAEAIIFAEDLVNTNQGECATVQRDVSVLSGDGISSTVETTKIYTAQVTVVKCSKKIKINGQQLDLDNVKDADTFMDHIAELRDSGFSNELASLCFRLLQIL